MINMYEICLRIHNLIGNCRRKRRMCFENSNILCTGIDSSQSPQEGLAIGLAVTTQPKTRKGSQSRHKARTHGFSV
jgi:hypothetical protein